MTMTSSIIQVPPDFVEESDIQRLAQVTLLPFAAQVTFYECLIEKYRQRHPFFLFRLAQLCSLSGCATMALQLYQESQHVIGNVTDPYLNNLIQTLSASAEEEVKSSLAAANAAHYYQRWKHTKEHKFPLSIPHEPSGHSELLSKWQALAPHASASFSKYLRKLAIETNQVESTFLLTRESIDDLVRRGVSEGVVKFLPESALQDIAQTKNILNDTLAAYDQIKALVDSDNPDLWTSRMICEIHARLMKTARFHGPKGLVATGHTRSFTRKSVLVTGTSYSIECCKYPDVDTELDYICTMAKQWIRNWRNPFGTASWIHLVFVRCHPFEDGNGRLTRLLASIPLMKAGYPPISISVEQRGAYYDAINRAYDGNHNPLINCILKGMQETFESVERL